MTAKHTAGTWTAEHDFAGGIAISSSHRRVTIAHVSKHAESHDQDTANASLICAAPDLLTALQAAQELLVALSEGICLGQEARNLLETIDDAIVKATA